MQIPAHSVGPLFDSFSESCSSVEGSLRGGSLFKERSASSSHQLSSLFSLKSGVTFVEVEVEGPASRAGDAGASTSQAAAEGVSPPQAAEPAPRPLRNSTSSGSLSALSTRTSPAPGKLHSSAGDEAVPTTVFYDFPSCSGTPPAPRWGHTAVAVGDRLFVYGGVGAKVYDDLWAFHAAQNNWKAVAATSANKKDVPPPMFGHAACSRGKHIYMVGGRQGRKHVPKTYVLDTEALQWRCYKETPQTPPASDGHSLTDAGQHGLLLFGGQAKKCMNATHKLDPSTLRWEPFKTIGVGPPPRQGHSAVWDESDSLIVFGGANGAQLYSDVHVLSLSTGYWSAPTCRGTPPSARSNHTAVMCTSSLMLVFGGCSSGGVFRNDTFLLDITTFTWHALKSINSAPAARYCHTCTLMNDKLVLYGGSNAQQSFDGIVLLTTNLGRDLHHVAEELAKMSNGAQERAQADTMALQLNDLLRRRGAQEQQQVAARKAEIAENLFHQERQRTQQLMAEVQELKLVLAEEEAARQETARGAKAEAERAARQRTELDNRLAQSQQQVEELRENVRERDERIKLLNTYQHKYDQLQHQWISMEDHCTELEHKVQTMEREQAALQQQLQQSETARAAATEQTLGQGQLLAKLKEYQEKLAAEKRRNHQLALDASAAGGAGSGSDQAGISAAQLDQQLKADQEEANAREHQLRQQLACLKGDPEALKLCSLPQLRSLESHVENAWRQIRTCLAASTEQELQKRDSALRALARAAEESATCSLCMDHPKSVVLNCGHQACQDCSQVLKHCPFCRAPITNRITLFKT